MYELYTKSRSIIWSDIQHSSESLFFWPIADKIKEFEKVTTVIKCTEVKITMFMEV